MNLSIGAKAMGVGIIVTLLGLSIYLLLNSTAGFTIIVIGWVVAAAGFLIHLSEFRREKNGKN
jgi:hypothetical protein